MNPVTMRWLDRISMSVLVLWAGIALGIALVAAPTAFGVLPSRELAGQVIGQCFRQVDRAAWVAFCLPFLLSYGSRWLSEIKDAAGIGPMRLWSGAVMVALLMCFTSAAIVHPRMEAIRSRIRGPIENLEPGHPDRVAFNRAHGISEQLLGLRVLLALVLAAGVPYLPGQKRKDLEDEQVPAVES